MIFGGKPFVTVDTQLIIRFTQSETENEVRRGEVEDAVIEYGVNAARMVFVSYGGMSEKGVYFFARGACQQADAYGIRSVSFVLLRLHGDERQAEEKKNKYAESR